MEGGREKGREGGREGGRGKWAFWRGGRNSGCCGGGSDGLADLEGRNGKRVVSVKGLAAVRKGEGRREGGREVGGGAKIYPCSEVAFVSASLCASVVVVAPHEHLGRVAGQDGRQDEELGGVEALREGGRDGWL
jgi:hypothetical protein